MQAIANAEIKTGLLLLAALALSACATKPSKTSPDVSEIPSQDIPHKVLQRFSIDPESSSIHIHAFPDGPLAKFGHNHLIAVAQLNGEIHVSEPLTASKISLRFPAAALSVDDPDLRQQAGDKFSSPVPQKDREGTRNNMLSPALLDAGQHPQIEITTHSISGSWPILNAELNVRIAGTSRRLSVDASVERDGGVIEIRSAFSVTHADLGLQPFSAMLGALKVRDTLDIKLFLRAHALE